MKTLLELEEGKEYKEGNIRYKTDGGKLSYWDIEFNGWCLTGARYDPNSRQFTEIKPKKYIYEYWDDNNVYKRTSATEKSWSERCSKYSLYSDCWELVKTIEVE